ncbi:MAG: MFS transporter, partial [Anaerolineales bacterium]|nr:MFS transporter [Anaerolineales bacterium]
TTLSQTNGLIAPLLVQQFVGVAEQGTFFGALRLWSLMVAVLVQSAMGLLSDHSTSRWGRRRPFIFTGTIFDLIFLFALGFLIGMEGMQGFVFLFILAILLSISSNTAHAAQQGLIPDLVPAEKRGRFSGVKAMLELPIPLLLVSFTIARLISQGYMMAGIIVAIIVLTICMIITMFVREIAVEGRKDKLDWSPFIRLLFMTIIFTVIILVMGEFVQQIGNLIRNVEIPITLVVIMGLSGLVAMIIAVALGVWLSIRISLGEDARKNQSYSWWVINRLAFLVGATNLSTFALFYLQARLGYVDEQAAQPASILMLIVGVFILIFALPSGWLADRFGYKRLITASGLLAFVGTVIALIVPSLTFIYIGGTLIGASTGIFFTANWALGTALVPKAEAGRYLGIANLAGAGAGAVGAYIGGPIADYFTNNVPDSPGLGYILLFSIYGMLFLFSVFAATRIKDKSSSA